MDQLTAERALRELEPLVGEWTLEAVGPDGVRWPGEGRTIFEWNDWGAHLIARFLTSNGKYLVRKARDAEGETATSLEKPYRATSDKSEGVSLRRAAGEAS